ncbi:polysaccharide biosynthesis C-terminal domain-containing protein [Nonomuraea endophytica]|uniref:MATE family multidrug resistance protein n=1 Tax=Nonomuraea endophytica TaxID=714136 RepID=A0A7W8ADR6_9ACTN|nr:MATE family efflux transporter [Nonomuraea endophytica]MBB5083196.1 MATE family multidrug resistance protein [Nonomuraea endophytica]
MVGSLVVAGVLGRHAPVTLAAFAVMTAVLNPAATAVAGALRGLMPFVAPHKDDPARAVPILRDARWLTLAVGLVGALAVLGVPLLAGVAGVPGEVVAELGALPYLLALDLLVLASNGGANTVLIALGRSRQVLWSGLANTATVIVLTLVLVPRWGLDGMGVAWLAAGLAGVLVSNVCLRRALGRPIGQARPRVAEILALARVSLPMAGTVLVKFGALGVVTFAATLTSVREAAAHAVLGTLTGFTFLASLAVAQAAVPEMARAATAAEVRRVNRRAAVLAVSASAAGGLALLLAGPALAGLFSDDPGVRASVLALVPLMLLSSMADAAQAVRGFGLSALKRAGVSLIYFAIGYGLLVAAAVPVARVWGITGLWVTMLAVNVLLYALQSWGFRKHSAQVGMAGAAERA